MIKEFRFADTYAYLNGENGKIVYSALPLSTTQLKKYRKFVSPFYTERNIDKYSVFTLGFNLSNKCNMNCAYCFSKGAQIQYTELETIISYIKKYVSTAKNLKRLFVDLSGCGEPLLRFSDIIEIADACKKIESSNEKTEIIVSFICNGTLLTADVIKKLQNSNILFGVSIDGDLKSNDQNRVDKKGVGTYSRIINNIASIEQKKLFGVSATINKAFKGNILKCYQTLHLLAPTVSIRLARDFFAADSPCNLQLILFGYDEFAEELIIQLNKNDFSLFRSVLNGDDEFAKFFCRVLLFLPTSYPCEGLVARHTFYKNKIYPCSPASVEGVFECDSLFETNSEFNMYNIYNNACNSCYAKRFCGGECPIVFKKRGSPDNFNCEIKRKFVTLSIQIVCAIQDNADVYRTVVYIAKERVQRNLI